MTNHYTDVCEETIESLRQQNSAQLAELDAISAALGTNEGHSSVNHILDLRKQLENEQARGIHSCGPNCSFDGCVNRRLREQLAEAKAVRDHNLKVYQDAAESLRQQLAEAQETIERLNRVKSRTKQVEIEQELTAALAAIRVKDAFLHMVTTEIRWSGDPMYEAACKALAATEPKELLK